MTKSPKTMEERTNPYAASPVKDDTTPGGSSFRLNFSFILALLLSGGLLLVILVTQSRYESFFTSFDLSLPSSTIFALSPAMLVLASALFLITVAKEFVGFRTKLVRLCNGIVCLVSLILGLVYVVSLFLPLITLVGTRS